MYIFFKIILCIIFCLQVFLQTERRHPLNRSILGLAFDLNDLILRQLESAHDREPDHDAEPRLSVHLARPHTTPVHGGQVKSEHVREVSRGYEAGVIIRISHAHFFQDGRRGGAARWGSPRKTEVGSEGLQGGRVYAADIWKWKDGKND